MLEEIIAKIKLSKWSEENKQNLLGLIKLLGENYLKFVYLESRRLGFDYVEDSFNEAVSVCILAEKKLMAGDQSIAKKILAVAPYRGWWENGAYILPWTLDIQQKIFKNKELRESAIQKDLLGFYLKMFKSLPDYLVNFILENYTLDIIKNYKVDLLVLLKKYVNLKHWENDSNIVKPFVNSLLDNNELVSNKKMEIDGKVQGVTVGNLLRDFISSSTRGGVKLSAYDVTKYLISNKSIQFIDEINKDSLLEILQIYIWLLHPVINEDDFLQDDGAGKDLEDYSEYDAIIFDLRNELKKINRKFVSNVESKVIALNDISEIQKFQPPTLKPAILNADIYKEKINQEPKVLVPPILPKPLPKIADQTKTKIDKKLDELEKRVGGKG